MEPAVKRLLPPDSSSGAASNMTTLAPCSCAASAAQNAALPHQLPLRHNRTLFFPTLLFASQALHRMCDASALAFPPPLRGRDREGGALKLRICRHPPPPPPPPRGRKEQAVLAAFRTSHLRPAVQSSTTRHSIVSPPRYTSAFSS